MIGIGNAPERVMQEFANAIRAEAPSPTPAKLESGQALAWFPKTGELHRLDIHLAHAERQRHKRTYAHGDLGDERSFYFRGPEGKLKLKSHNLTTFLQLAQGVDDETWLYHLRRGDYSKWIRERIKDDELAGEIAQYERDSDERESRERIKTAIEQRYTAPA